MPCEDVNVQLEDFRAESCSYTGVPGPGSQERELPIFQTKYFRRGICQLSQVDISIAIVPDRYSHIVLIRYDYGVGHFPDASHIGFVRSCKCRPGNPLKQYVAVEDVAFARST